MLTASVAVLALSGAVVQTGAAAPVRAAAARQAPKASHGALIPVHPVVSHYESPAKMPEYQTPKVVWPTGEAVVSLVAGSPGAVRAGTLPVSLSAAKQGGTPGSVKVRMLSGAQAEAAGVNGAVLSLEPLSGAGGVVVRLDYSSFAGAFGGDWASRLKLVALPGCAVSSPGRAECRTQTPVAFRNDVRTRSLTAEVPVGGVAPAAGGRSGAMGPMVLAATSSAGGGGGDFTATSLHAAESWRAGGSIDSFDWSYPIDTPNVPGELEPKVGLGYDSQSLDGLTSSTNNQASAIGDGFGYTPGFVERSYASCNDNPAGATKTQDECWSANTTVTLSLGGHSSTLVKDDATGTWRAQDDENERVQMVPATNNGGYNGEYWVVTTDDGTQYFFGLNQLPGYVAGNTQTNSAWTVPVYATASGQPCYNATFANSWCMQAYRWNLDYVVDPHQDTISYYYSTKTGYYARDLGTTANTSYTRGGYLNEIAYGQRDKSVYSTSPAARVLFHYTGRCNTSTAGCDTSTLTSSTAASWPDVPYDLNCANGAACSVNSPTFWSEYELQNIQTQALVGTTETNVDSWTFEHTFPATGDSTSPSLWLSTITRTGQDTSAGGSASAQSVPAVSLTGTPLSNRVNVTNGYPPITRQRMLKITTETGARINVNYSSPDCASGTPADPSQNTKLCFPQYWTPSGQTSPILDWFNKYRVTGVTEQDDTGGSGNDTIATTYTPVGLPAWHYDDDPMTKSGQRTWNQWRGYQGMHVTVGTAPDPVTETDYTYFRGMDGDTLPGGLTRSVTITDSRGDPAVTDSEQFAGHTYETIERPAAGSTAYLSDEITDPWASAATASHALSGLPTQKAYLTGENKEREYSPLAAGGTRQIETDYTHDGYGRVTKTDDLGDVGTAGDDLCHTTAFADNTTAWILDKPAEQTTVSVNCSTTPSLPGNAVADTRTFYDGSTTLGVLPAGKPGDISMVQKATSYTGSTPVFSTMATSTVDEYGRTLSATDPDSRTTTTAYTPATGAEPTEVDVTDPKTFITKTVYDPLRGLALQTTDPALYVTKQQYDALGRLTAVFKPGITAASQTYSYTVNNGAPSYATTNTLNDDGSYRTSIEIYDALLRIREVQDATVDGNRTITDTNYNTLGLKSKTTSPYASSGAPSAAYVQAADNTIPDESTFVYDGAGRQTVAVESALSTETWRTTTVYNGDDATTTVPPAGATASSQITDARGRTTAVYRYHAGVPADPVNDTASQYDRTAYTYTPDGKRASMTDAAKNTWSWIYDLLGNQITATDPDTGTTQTTYDNAGQELTNTDARGKQTTYTYDVDGRKKAAFDTTGNVATSAANQTGAWTYDTLKNGMPTGSTSFQMGTASPSFSTQIQGYNSLGLVVASTDTLANLPANEAALAPSGGYTTSYTYNLTGTLDSQSDPASGGLASEKITYGYDKFGHPTTTGGAWTYVSATGYDEYDHPTEYTLGPTSSKALLDLSYDPQTEQITEAKTTTNVPSTQIVDDTKYTYNNNSVSKGAGLLVSTSDTQNGTATDTQCFTYDWSTRLTGAWTATDNCTATPAPGNSSTVGGTNPYWQTWTYDTAGDRATQTDHDTTGATANDTTTTYNYPAPGSATDQPHTLTGTTATGPAASVAAHTATYTYDTTGNTASITGGVTGNQTLTWNDQGKLATDTTTAGTTGYLYDADGSLVLRTDPSQATLFLGDEEITENLSTHALTGVRYYSIGGETVAERTSDGDIQYLIPDRQNTDTLAIDYQTQNVTRRQYLPFGDQRGTAPANWPGDKGYVGGHPDTATSLENLGAREYNPATGRFLSPDPILETDDPNQIAGYDYAGNNPVTHSDPDGTMIKDDVTGLGFGNVSNMRHWYHDQGYTDSHGHATRKFQRVLKRYDHSWTVFYHSSYYKWLQHQPPTFYHAPKSPVRKAQHSKAHHHCGAFSWACSLGHDISRGANAAYHLSGASDVVGCVSDPSIGGCSKAAALSAGFVLTGGEDELEVAAFNAAEEGGTVDLYRAVGVREYESVMKTGGFHPGGSSLEGRQFAFTQDEALAYANWDKSKVAILRATVDRSALSHFDFSRNIDVSIFRNGVITVQPGAQSDIFHTALRGVEHVL